MEYVPTFRRSLTDGITQLILLSLMASHKVQFRFLENEFDEISPLFPSQI
jgi:hypothetical protein